MNFHLDGMGGALMNFHPDGVGTLMNFDLTDCNRRKVFWKKCSL